MSPVLLTALVTGLVTLAACPVLVLPRGASEKSEALLADAVAQAQQRGEPGVTA